MGNENEQASSAEQLRVSMAMATAAHPALQVVRIKEGALSRVPREARREPWGGDRIVQPVVGYKGYNTLANRNGSTI